MRLEEFDSQKPVLKCCVSSVQQWCARRRLQLNEDKSELIWFASRCMLKKLRAKDTTMTVWLAIIKPVESVRNLGVILDSQLTMQAHQGCFILLFPPMSTLPCGRTRRQTAACFSTGSFLGRLL